MKTLLIFSLVVAQAVAQVIPPQSPESLDLPTASAPAAPQAQVTATMEQEVTRVGRPVGLTIRVLGGETAPDMPVPFPAPAGLTVEPSGTTTGFQFGKGGKVSMSTLRFQVTASKAGQFVIPAFTLTAGTQQLRVPELQLNVIDSPAGEPAFQPVKAYIDLPDREFYVGESINARLLLPETPDENPQYISHVSKTSGTALFQPAMRSQREEFKVQNQPARGLVMPVTITPLKEGDSELNCQIMVQVLRMDGTGRRAGFSSMNTIETQSFLMRTRALPAAGRLPGFTGGIGHFTVAQPQLSVKEIEVGEPVTLSVLVQGEGNLEGVMPPELPAGDDWQSYPPTSDMRGADDMPAAAKSAKAFTYTLVPKREGLKATPKLPFSYFDPMQRVYVDATIPPLAISVKAGPDPVVKAVATAAAPEPEAPAAALPILTGLEEQPGRWVGTLQPSLFSRWFLAAQLAPPLFLVLLWAWRRWVEFHAAHPEVRQRRKARAAARRQLRLARTAAHRGDAVAFYTAGTAALREAAARLDTARPDSLVADEVLHYLREDERTNRAARSLFAHAEATRFSKAKPDATSMRELLPEIETAVRRLFARS